MLNKAQSQFVDAMFNAPENLAFIASSQKAERLNVYRQTIFLNLQHCLSITFPGIWQLLGQACADSVSYAFYAKQQNLPTTGCLDDYGAQFPTFLATIEQLRPWAYLSDYANYEWLKHQVEHENDDTPIEIFCFQYFSDEDWDKTYIDFIDAFQMLTSDFPINDIEQALKTPDLEVMQLSQSPSYGIIARPQQALLTDWLTYEKWMFIYLLWKGGSILQSMDTIQTQFPAFNFSEAIYFMFQHQLIKKIRRAS